MLKHATSLQLLSSAIWFLHCSTFSTGNTLTLSLSLQLLWNKYFILIWSFFLPVVFILFTLQVMPPNNSNASNLVQNNTTKFRPQFGMNNNPQTQVPFNNSNMRPSINRPGFMNPPLQNSHLGMPHLGSQPGQSHVGFSPQNKVCNMNPVQGFPVNGQFCNMAQNPNQVNVSQPAFVHNMQNSNQQLNQNMGFPNGQFCMPNMLQNMNQFMPLQMPNSSQVVSYGIPICPPYMGVPNQATRATVPQNPTFFANSQFGLGHCNQVRQQVSQNQQSLVPPTANANALKTSPFVAQQLQGGNLPALPSHCSVQPQDTRNYQASVFTGAQVALSCPQYMNCWVYCCCCEE